MNMVSHELKEIIGVVGIEMIICYVCVGVYSGSD